MSSQINRPPFGLQSLLESQNFGQNPNALLLDVRPTIELDKFFKFPNLRRDQVQNTAVAAINANAEVLVPNNEVWEIVAWDGQVVNSAAAGARARIMLRLRVLTPEPVGGTGLFASDVAHSEAPTILDATATTVRYGVTWNAPENTFVGPGCGFQALVTDLDLNGGTSVTLTSAVLYYKYTF